MFDFLFEAYLEFLFFNEQAIYVHCTHLFVVKVPFFLVIFKKNAILFIDFSYLFPFLAYFRCIQIVNNFIFLFILDNWEIFMQYFIKYYYYWINYCNYHFVIVYKLLGSIYVSVWYEQKENNKKSLYMQKY